VQAPWEWLVSRVCEEFGCLPSAAIRELEEMPVGLVFDVMALRSYARTKDRVDAAKKASDMPTGPVADLVLDVQAEISQRRLQERRERRR